MDRLSVWINFELARSAKRQNIHRHSINPITIFLKMFSISQNKGRNRAASAVKKLTKVTFLKQSIILNNGDHQDEGPFPAGQSTMDRLLLVVQCVIGGGKVKLHHHNDHYHNWPPYHKIHLFLVSIDLRKQLGLLSKIFVGRCSERSFLFSFLSM